MRKRFCAEARTEMNQAEAKVVNISEGWPCTESAFRLLQEPKHPALHEQLSVGENFQNTTNTAGRHEQQVTKSSRCAGGIYSGCMKTVAAMWVSSQEAVCSSGASGIKLGIVQSSRLSMMELCSPDPCLARRTNTSILRLTNLNRLTDWCRVGAPGGLRLHPKVPHSCIRLWATYNP